MGKAYSYIKKNYRPKHPHSEIVANYLQPIIEKKMKEDLGVYEWNTIPELVKYAYILKPKDFQLDINERLGFFRTENNSNPNIETKKKNNDHKSKSNYLMKVIGSKLKTATEPEHISFLNAVSNVILASMVAKDKTKSKKYYDFAKRLLQTTGK